MSFIRRVIENSFVHERRLRTRLRFQPIRKSKNVFRFMMESRDLQQ